jgi:nicotinate-nucleotide adenylyltransferase
VDTLRELRRRLGEATELVLLIGADQYAEFDSWREPAEVSRLARLAVLHREGRTETPALASTTAQDVAVTRIDVSSTAVRARAAAGASIRYLVPDPVADYITEHRLYQLRPETGPRSGGIETDARFS